MWRYVMPRLAEHHRVIAPDLRGHEDPVITPRVELVDHAGHFITEDRPELVAERALGFFAASSRG